MDSNGVVNPTAPITVSLSLSAGGDTEADAAGLVTLAAVGSGDPSDPSSFTASNRTTWHGRATAVLRPVAGKTATVGGSTSSDVAASVTLTASADKLTAGQVTISLNASY